MEKRKSIKVKGWKGAVSRETTYVRNTDTRVRHGTIVIIIVLKHKTPKAGIFKSAISARSIMG